MSNLDRFIETFLNGAVLAKYTPAILSGVWVTVELSVLIVIAGTVLGVALACIRAYRIRPVSFVIVIYADIFRALPPLVLILLE